MGRPAKPREIAPLPPRRDLSTWPGAASGPTPVPVELDADQIRTWPRFVIRLEAWAGENRIQVGIPESFPVTFITFANDAFADMFRRRFG